MKLVMSGLVWVKIFGLPLHTVNRKFANPTRDKMCRLKEQLEFAGLALEDQEDSSTTVQKCSDFEKLFQIWQDHATPTLDFQKVCSVPIQAKRGCLLRAQFTMFWLRLLSLFVSRRYKKPKKKSRLDSYYSRSGGYFFHARMPSPVVAVVGSF